MLVDRGNGEPPEVEPAAGSPSVTQERLRTWQLRLAACEEVIGGLLMGVFDLFNDRAPSATFLGYCGAGFLLGTRHSTRAWAAFPPLGVSLFAVHVAAITCGLGLPYIEEEFLGAIFCLPVAALASAIGLFYGAVARFALPRSIKAARAFYCRK